MNNKNENIDEQEEFKELQSWFGSFPEPDVPEGIMQKVQSCIDAELESHHGRIRMRMVSILSIAAMLAIAFGVFFMNNEPTDNGVVDSNILQAGMIGDDNVLYEVGAWQASVDENIDDIAMDEILTLWSSSENDNGNIKESLEPITQKNKIRMQC